MENAARWYDDIFIPALLRHARSAYGNAMRRLLDAEGYDDIPGNGLYVIGALAAEGEGSSLRIGQLVHTLGITKQGAGQLVDTLVTRGYLARTPDAEDRRQLIVTLAPRGHAAAELQAKARGEVDAELLARIGADDVARGRRMLGTLIEIAREQTAAARAVS